MGGGFAGFVTPGWMTYEKSLSPHISTPAYVKKMLKDGENPKELVLEECKPLCKYWKEKLERCEH
jgi:hypothetical protein